MRWYIVRESSITWISLEIVIFFFEGSHKTCGRRLFDEQNKLHCKFFEETFANVFLARPLTLGMNLLLLPPYKDVRTRSDLLRNMSGGCY